MWVMTRAGKPALHHFCLRSNITFEYFQKNEGIVVNLYHTGKSQTKILPQGTVIGGEQLVQFRQKDLLIDAFGNTVFGWFSWFPKTKNWFLKTE